MDVNESAAPGGNPNGVDEVTGGSTATPAAPAAVVDEDPADRELRLAEEALAAAASGNAATPANPEGTVTPAAESNPPATPTEPDASGKTPATVPVAVAKAERERRQKAEQEAAYWKGRAEATEAMRNPPTEQPNVEAAKTPDQRLAEIRAARLDLADKYDNGDIRTRDWEEQRTALEDEERRIRESLTQPTSTQPVQDLTLEERTAQLETQYPVLKSLTEDDLQPLVAIAYREAAKEGKPIQPGAVGSLDLRTRVAQIANRLHGQTQPTTTTQPGSTGATRPATPAAPTVPAGQPLAETHPIDAGSLGAGGNAGVMTEAEIEGKLSSMSLDEQADFLASQPALVQRVVGRLGR